MRLLLLLLLIPSLTCNEEPIPIDYRAQCDEMDTVTASGNELDFWLAPDSTVMITWKNSSHEKMGVLPGEKMPGWSPHYYFCEFENYIGMRYGCGSSCWSLTLLPLVKGDSILNFMEDLAVDTKRGYIFANECPGESGEFCLYNVNTGIHTTIRPEGMDSTADILNQLDSVAFVDEGLFLRWTSYADMGDGYTPPEMIIPLE